MTISTAAFGAYFHLMSGTHSSSVVDIPGQVAPDALTNLSWLALVSMGVFIIGETLEIHLFTLYLAHPPVAIQHKCTLYISVNYSDMQEYGAHLSP